MKVSYYRVVSFHLAALAIRTSDELLKKAGRLDPRSPALFVIILLDMIVLAVGALIQLGGVENIDHLVTTGFFGTVRHLEEQHLETSVGAAYREYRARTWF